VAALSLEVRAAHQCRDGIFDAALASSLPSFGASCCCFFFACLSDPLQGTTTWTFLFFAIFFGHGGLEFGAGHSKGSEKRTPAEGASFVLFVGEEGKRRDTEKSQ